MCNVKVTIVIWFLYVFKKIFYLLIFIYLYFLIVFLLFVVPYGVCHNAFWDTHCSVDRCKQRRRSGPLRDDPCRRTRTGTEKITHLMNKKLCIYMFKLFHPYVSISREGIRSVWKALMVILMLITSKWKNILFRALKSPSRRPRISFRLTNPSPWNCVPS